jgi:hypothetical protein
MSQCLMPFRKRLTMKTDANDTNPEIAKPGNPKIARDCDSQVPSVERHLAAVKSALYPKNAAIALGASSKTGARN